MYWLVGLLYSLFQLNSTPDKIIVGKPCPDFVLRRVENYKDSIVSLHDLKGKYFILDIWSLHCSHSVKIIPEINQLQKKIKADVQFFLVGVDFKTAGYTKKVFDTMKEKYKLELPVAYDNDKLSEFDVSVVPKFIWVDSTGIIRAVTTDEHVTESNIQDFLQGRNLSFPNLPVKSIEDSIYSSFNFSKPFLVNGNGGKTENFKFRSVIADWNVKVPAASQLFLEPPTGNQMFMSAMDLKGLYRVAYADTVANYPKHPGNTYGKVWPNPVLETRDSALFTGEYFTGKRLFAYSVVVPPEIANRATFQRIMRNDLASYFGYKVKWKYEKKPYWKITVDRKAREKLRTKGGMPSRANFQFVDYTIRNKPMNDLIVAIWGNHQEKPPFIDESGITFNIDITIPGLIFDFDSMRNELAKQGINLKKSRKRMKVMVISDP